jgi:hypothetical protein
MRTISLLSILLILLMVFGPQCSTRDSETDIRYSWVCSKNFEITIMHPEGEPFRVTSGYEDYKPTWSKTGSWFAFFRLLQSQGPFYTFRTRICVVQTDGSGFRELTSGIYPDFNPTWTRDGSNRILFNRYNTTGDLLMQVYWTTPNSSPGQEQLISDPDYPYFEWANSGLMDGRIFIDRIEGTIQRAYLLTPNPGQAGTYEELTRPTNLFWHKLSVSPSETRVCYMLDYDRDLNTYNDATICYADLDIQALTITNQVEITTHSLGYTTEYPRWDPDENLIIFNSDQSGIHQMYAYSLSDGTTRRISPDLAHSYQYGSFENIPK